MAAQQIPLNFGSRVGRSYPRAQAMDAQAAKIDIEPVSAQALEKAALGAINASDKAKQRARKYFQ